VSKEGLEQTLRNWQEKLAYFENELSITASSMQKFELQKRIQECEREIKRIETSLKSLGEDGKSLVRVLPINENSSVATLVSN
jgi:septal ring factor EnvC (AmiA/AmiB activator)